MLHIVNGTSVLQSLSEGGVEGSYLSWVDPLHDGPVPVTATLEELSDVRARALSGFGWGSYEDIRAVFEVRDAALSAFRAHGETVLWFEYDLYDQLQLIQLLDWFSQQDLDGTHVSLIQSDRLLGILTGVELSELLPGRLPVKDDQLAAGRHAWAAFRSSDEAALRRIAGGELRALPFLAKAMQRWLEEWPSPPHGLSRTELQLLEAGAAGAVHRADYYVASSRREEATWGDASVFLRLDGLANRAVPALVRDGEDYRITAEGLRLIGAS